MKMSDVRGRPFEAGNRMGQGRPKGSLNKKTMLLDDLLQEFGPALMKTCIKKGLEGDPTALRLCIERLVAPRRDSRVKLPLPKIESIRDAQAAMGRIVRATGAGKISPQSALTMTETLKANVQVIESCDLERRIEQLEENAAAKPEQPSSNLLDFKNRKAG
jgi:hypothetical protein